MVRKHPGLAHCRKSYFTLKYGLIGIQTTILQAANKYVYVRKKIHDKYVHVMIDNMTSPKNQTNSLLAYTKHLKLDKLEGRAERCGTEDIQV